MIPLARPRSPHPLLPAFLALLSLGLVGCGTKPRLVVTPTKLDFGRVVQGELGVLHVRIQNRGEDAVRLLHVAANCSCFLVDPVLSPLLEPGEERRLRVRFNSLGKEGPIRGKKLDIVTDDRRDPHVEVPILGDVLVPLSVQPSRVVLGGPETSPESASVVVRVRPENGMTIQLLDYRVAPKENVKLSSEQKDGGADLTVSLAGKAPVEGRIHATLALRVRISGPGIEERVQEYTVPVSTY